MHTQTIEYDGKMPPALLAQRVEEGKFYIAEEMRGIILDTFPNREGVILLGLELICVGDQYMQDAAERMEHARQSLVRRPLIMKELVPGYQGKPVDVVVVESQVYKDKSGKTQPSKNATKLHLSEYGYSLLGFRTFPAFEIPALTQRT